MSIQVAHECAGAQCSQTRCCSQTGVGASSFSFVNAGMLFTNRGGPSYKKREHMRRVYDVPNVALMRTSLRQLRQRDCSLSVDRASAAMRLFNAACGCQPLPKGPHGRPPTRHCFPNDFSDGRGSWLVLEHDGAQWVRSLDAFTVCAQ
jgi:hypothetical protein